MLIKVTKGKFHKENLGHVRGKFHKENQGLSLLLINVIKRKRPNLNKR